MCVCVCVCVERCGESESEGSETESILQLHTFGGKWLRCVPQTCVESVCLLTSPQRFRTVAVCCVPCPSLPMCVMSLSLRLCAAARAFIPLVRSSAVFMCVCVCVCRESESLLCVVCLFVFLCLSAGVPY